MTGLCYSEKVISTRSLSPRPFGQSKTPRFPQLRGAFGRARPPLKIPSTAKPFTHSNPTNYIDPSGLDPNSATGYDYHEADVYLPNAPGGSWRDAEAAYAQWWKDVGSKEGGAIRGGPFSEEFIASMMLTKGLSGILGGIRYSQAVSKMSQNPCNLRTLQGKVSGPAVDRYVKMIKSGRTAPPITVDGDIIIEGNHRYAAGIRTGVMPAQRPGTLPASQARSAFPFEHVRVDPVDWNNH